MTPDEFRAAFIKSRGLNLNSAPAAAPVAAPPPPPMDPIRMPPQAAIDAWRQGNPLPAPPPAAAAPPPAPIAAFPQAAPPVPQVPAGAGPGGITLNSTPMAPGWAGTVGLPATPEAAKSFQAGTDYAKALGGLEEIAKGIKNKPAAPSDLNTISPMSGATGNTGAGGQMGAQLLAQMLQHSRRNYGMSLTG